MFSVFSHLYITGEHVLFDKKEGRITQMGRIRKREVVVVSEGLSLLFRLNLLATPSAHLADFHGKASLSRKTNRNRLKSSPVRSRWNGSIGLLRE